MAAPREPAALLWLISLGRCALLGVPVRTPGRLLDPKPQAARAAGCALSSDAGAPVVRCPGKKSARCRWL